VLGTVKGVLERNVKLVLQVVAAGRPATPTTATSHAVENITEHREDVVRIHRAEVVTWSLTQTVVPILVIHPTTLVVSQNLVGLSGLLELLLSFGVIRIAIRVVLHRQPTVRTLDLVPGSVTGDAKDLVVAASR